MTEPDYAVSPAALDVTAAGIEAVLGGLRALGPIGTAEQGRGVARLALMPGDVGHAELNTAFVTFCDRWEWGVRAAVRSGEDMADGLRAVAASYGHADAMGQDLLARAASDVAGDPGAPGVDTTSADVAAAQRPDWRMPDWGRVGAQWADTGRDLVEDSAPGMLVRALTGADLSRDQLDDLRPMVD